MKTEIKFTRVDCMAKKCTHREYFAQFVTPSVKAVVKRVIGVEAIQASKDPHLNDIELSRWDRLCDTNRGIFAMPPESLEWPGRSERLYNLANAVCIAKEAARQIIEENKATQPA